MTRYMALGLMLGLMPGVMAAPTAAQQVDLGGQIRPRLELRDPVATRAGDGERTAEFTSMRTRLSLTAALAPRLSAFIQLQDVRVWGEERSTLDAAADALDLHQAWLELGDPADGPYAVRIGRQELVYGGQRLVGAVNWAQQARAFDGVRLRYRPSETVTVDGFAAQVGDEDALAPPATRPDEALLGLYGRLELAGSLEPYVLYHTVDHLTDRRTGESGDLSKTYTLGGRWSSAARGFDWRIEAAYQTGEDRPEPASPEINDVSAYLFAVRAGTTLGDDLQLRLWYDFLSGDGNPDDRETRVFDTLFATNHEFYGYMDLFVNIPVDTRGRGLQDLALKASYDLAPRHVVDADFHTFFYSATEGLDSGHIGEELDLTYRWSYAPGFAITGGASYFFAGDGAPLPRAPAADEGMVWGYVMVDVAF